MTWVLVSTAMLVRFTGLEARVSNSPVAAWAPAASGPERARTSRATAPRSTARRLGEEVDGGRLVEGIDTARFLWSSWSGVSPPATAREQARSSPRPAALHPPDEDAGGIDARRSFL